MKKTTKKEGFSKTWLIFSVGRLITKDMTPCATDAAIWAEQQLVAIPGWLLEEQNARLDQEEQFASIKEPRWPTI
jgi:hypothetical protein